MNVIGGTFRLAKVLSKVFSKVLAKVTATIFALALALALGIGSTVHAADIVPRYDAAPPQPYTLAWAGPYVGATLGYEWGSIDNNPTRPSGVAGGIEAGFNWQTGNFVYGGEVETICGAPVTPCARAVQHPVADAAQTGVVPPRSANAAESAKIRQDQTCNRATAAAR